MVERVDFVITLSDGSVVKATFVQPEKIAKLLVDNQALGAFLHCLIATRPNTLVYQE